MLNLATVVDMAAKILTYRMHSVLLRLQFCRLVFEILNADYPDASERLKPLDQSVLDYLFGFGHMMPDKLIPVNGPQRVQIIAAKRWRKHYWQ